jgi:hypothetical protein
VGFGVLVALPPMVLPFAQALRQPKAHAWIYTHHIDWTDKVA